MTEPRLTHVDETGAARMVDVSAKAVTAREATAAGRVLVSAEVIDLLRGKGVPKGDAVAVARIAGIAGAKRTPDLVPLCHPIALHGVTVDIEVADDAVEITATARTADRTGVPKGDAVAVARIAGIAGAKRTPDLVPLCHPIALHGVTVDIEVTDEAVEITATARTADRTGVEMEALTSVAVAGLTMIDMVKAVDPRASITDVRLLRKSGGKSGLWTR